MDGESTQRPEALVLAKPYSVFDLPRLWLYIFRYGGIWWRRHWWHAAALKMTPFWFQKTFDGGSKAIKWVRKKILSHPTGLVD